ncbi:KINB2 [Symbiodinium pilosum]|uniref:KINB2 protein n=1 Tax=Symbiodinium pilosum TaxID=2952 RepID=A0A812Q4A2_SYMPI|nr:KINB2 [Symbiodinium pilosum]
MTSSVTVDSEKDDRIPVVFTWTHGGQNVFLAASFNGWRDQIPMVRSGQEFSVVQELPRGVHQYKFIVDDQWRFAPDQPRMQDSQGNMNNVLDISAYQRFQVSLLEEKEAPLKFGQLIPDPNDYTLDAPVVPMVLGKSTYAAIPTRLAPGQGPMNIPTHCLCDHIYLREHSDDAPFVVSVTHRYGQKYSTTVYVARSSFGDSERSLPTGFNPLKAAIRRTAKCSV